MHWEREKVSKYIDGKLESFLIDDDYNLDGIRVGIESCGYTRAYAPYDLETYKDDLELAEKIYKRAKEQYELAKANTLYNSEVQVNGND